jgi:hypothetical protein
VPHLPLNIGLHNVRQFAALYAQLSQLIFRGGSASACVIMVNPPAAILIFFPAAPWLNDIATVAAFKCIPEPVFMNI